MSQEVEMEELRQQKLIEAQRALDELKELSEDEGTVLKQQHHKLAKALDSGEDEHGSYDIIPLSMMRGGELNPRVVYKKPLKHLVLDQGIAPRGWYKDKWAEKRVRPRPCYTEALLTSPYGGFCHVGCSFSLDYNSEVITPDGPVKIGDMKVGDIVLCRNSTGTIWDRVEALHNHLVDCQYAIVTDMGELISSDSHPIMIKGKGWVIAKELEIGDEVETIPSSVSPGFYAIEEPEYSPIIDLIKVDTPLEVFDIQTTSGNFYANGLLVHNCYINNGSRGYKSTGLSTVDPDYPEKYQKQFDKLMVAGAGYMSSFTEVFQILEDEYHVTERLTKVFTEANLPIFYCTRRLPPEWAIDALAENPYSYIQWSVNTGDPAEFKRLSPGAARWEDIMDYVARLTERGIYTSFQCNPINAGITTLESLFHLIDVASQAGLKHIIFKFTEQVMNTRSIIIDRLNDRKFDPKKVKAFDQLFSQVIGGVYTIRQDVRIDWLKYLLEKTRSVGITQSLCYEYYADGHAGSNMAPWFTTADQCHGRGIPVHYRPAPGEKFQPFPCYRKGCLYCDQAGTLACNNDILLEAKALSYKDLREIKLYEPKTGWDWSVKESCAHPSEVRTSPARNPGLVTDAELWGWPSLEYVIENRMTIDDIDDWIEAQETGIEYKKRD